MENSDTELEARLENLKIQLPRYSRNALISRACKQHNERQREKARKLDDLYAEIQTISPHAHPNVLARTTVNYLQSLCEARHPDLAALRGQPAQFALYARFRSVMLDAIAQTYDWLRDECERQRMV